MSQNLIYKNLHKKQSDPNRGKNECHPNPNLAADRQFPLGIQVISQCNGDENDGNGNENDSD